MNTEKLKFIAISGTTGVTENLYVYEYGNDIIVVDCGVGFPDSSMYGVDLVIPDMSYIEKNKNKLRGAFISHGHEDHIGAIPFLLEKVNTPVHASLLTAKFIEDKLEDYGMKDKKVKVFNPERDSISAGVFRVTPFRVSHSVPDAVGFAIDTPEGRIFHVPDYKFDWTSVDQRPFDVAKVAMLASEGALALASDSLGSSNPGYTESERAIEERIEAVVVKSKGKVYFTTISSNISRMQQAINVARKMGRRVAFVGRSIDKKANIAKEIGQLKYPKGLVISSRRAKHIKKNEIMYIISGSYGQPSSALFKLSMGEHDYLKVESQDTVIFSADPAPPGSKTNVDVIVDRLIEMNVDVHYYDMQEDLHVSGHGSIEDIKMLFALVKPKYFIPIGGTVRHMHNYGKLAEAMGAKPNEVFQLKPGGVVNFIDGRGSIGKSVPVKSVLIDGLGVGDVGNMVLRDRKILAKEGIVVAVVHFDPLNKHYNEEPEIISRGFVFEKQHKDFLLETGKRLKKYLIKNKVDSAQNIRNQTVQYLENYFFNETGRRPMVLPVVIGV